MISFIIWGTALWLVTIVLAFCTAWHFGKKEGIALEHYRNEVQSKIDHMPYSGLFYSDDPAEKAKLAPLVIRQKGKRHGIS
jgi:hypothetical protein